AAPEPGQVDRLALEPVGEQEGEIGPVQGGATESVDIEGRLGTVGRRRGTADEGGRAVDVDGLTGPGRDHPGDLREVAHGDEASAFHIAILHPRRHGTTYAKHPMQWRGGPVTWLSPSGPDLAEQ